jgi:8-oxo-dGTP diphosphatase
MSTNNRRTFPVAYVTTDVVLFTIDEGALQVVLIERGEAPSGLALPGGFLKPGEDLLDCARRELLEETGIELGGEDLEQLQTYGAPDRDPRYRDEANERVVTVAYWGIIPDLPAPRGGSDAERALLQPVRDLEKRRPLELVFDHNQIVRDALRRARAKIEVETIATQFCQDAFTMSELREVYEVIWGVAIDPGNFTNRMKHLAKSGVMLEATERVREGRRGRPAPLYRSRATARLDPPFLKPKTSGD